MASRQARPPATSSQAEALATVEIVEAGGPWLDYRYDERQRALVAERLVPRRAERGFDWGVLPKTLTESGRAREVCVLGALSPMPGALARVRLVGLLESTNDGQNDGGVLLAVLEGDPCYVGVREAAELPPEHLAAVLEPLGGAARVVVRGAEAARARVRDDLARAARARAEADKGGWAAPAWQVAGPRAQEAGAAEAYTHAEREVLRLPFRFQRYVAECLAVDERLLLHVTRPPMSDPEAGFRLLGRRKLHEALLVLSDQQVLLMEDAIPPDVTLVHWGYVARAAPLERLAGVRLEEDGETASLQLLVEAAGGVEAWRIAFPRDRRGWLCEAKRLLAGWLPTASSRALRRCYRVEPRKEPPGEELDERGRQALADLGAQLRRSLRADEAVLAEALAPGRADERRPDRLLAVTDRALWLVEAGKGPRVVPLEAIASLEFRHSLLGNGLGVALPRAGRVERLNVEVEGPAVANFVPLFLALRRLVARGTPAGASQADIGAER